MQSLDLMLADQKHGWIKLKEVRSIAEKCGVTSTSEQDIMLAFFHEIGSIVHFTSTPSLASLVTVSPQWLVDSISMYI
jgi:hypothetical protein